MAQLAQHIVGHKEVLDRLFTALKRGQLPHALLFSGSSGIGKKQVAMALAQTLICEENERPACGQCPSCLRVEKRTSEALLFVEPDGPSIKIESAKDIIRALALRQWRGSRVVMIDQAEKLNPQAGNALLKVIEEPPEDTFFILVTSSLSSVLPTIRSRCQLTRFKPLTNEEVQKITGAKGWVLRSAQGSVERVHQLSSDELNEWRQIAIQSLKTALREGSTASLAQLQEYLKDRESLIFILRCWQQLIRDAKTFSYLDSLHADQSEFLQQLAQVDHEILDRLYLISQQMIRDIEGNVDRTLTFESALYKVDELMGKTL